MADLILHHHDPSPFGEKIRLCLGLKGLAWDSVQVPMLPPRPLVEPLTGGYRKIPVLQAGADIYCDTRLIARELERRYPQPSLFPQGSEGVAIALAAWSDRSFFDPGAGLSMGLNRSMIPPAIIEDRKDFFNFMDFDRLEDDLPHLFTQFSANLSYVERMLADGRRFVLGDAPSFADIDAYFPVWMARGNIGDAPRLLQPFERLRAWEARMDALPRGIRREIDGEQALDVARAATPLEPLGVEADDPLRLSSGDAVVVTPDDYGRIPVTGELVTLNVDEVAVRLRSAPIGEVIVHFPRLGYRVERGR
jgi:glutathione S-transferase